MVKIAIIWTDNSQMDSLYSEGWGWVKPTFSVVSELRENSLEFHNITSFCWLSPELPVPESKLTTFAQGESGGGQSYTGKNRTRKRRWRKKQMYWHTEAIIFCLTCPPTQLYMLILPLEIIHAFNLIPPLLEHLINLSVTNLFTFILSVLVIIRIRVSEAQTTYYTHTHF